MIDYSKLERSLYHLQLQFENYKTQDDSQPILMREAIEESVIQRFETCWDCLWKVLKRFLGEALGIPELPNSPKPILRIAADNKLFSAPVERWLTYANARIGTSHDYNNGQKAQEALTLMGNFLLDAKALYVKLSGNAWRHD